MPFYFNKILKKDTLPRWFFLFTTIFALIMLYVFYGEVLRNPNQCYFASGGDGLQNYYNHIYHVKYDSTYFRSSGMNYPYGEMVYFTGVQLVPVGILKFLNSHVCDITVYMIGIQNVTMLLSIVFGALILYLIFLSLKVPCWFSAFFSVFIAFLSPQLDRFGGHYSLTYVFVVPLIVYLYIRFYQKPGGLLSVIIGAFAFWAFTTHPYFFGMLAVVWLFYWVYWFFVNTKKDMPNSKAFLFCFLQLLLPYLIVQLFALLFDPVTDRTSAPWGFLVYKAFPEGVFLPFGKPYGQFLYSIFKSTDYIEWEGIAYVGVVGVLGFLAALWGIAIKIRKRRYKEILGVTNSRILNILFWSSLAALLYSFGWPFVLGMEWLVDFVGPLKQMRGIGRFAWVFFYIINIITVYQICQMAGFIKKQVVLCLALLLLGYDAYLNVRHKQASLINKIPELVDVNNSLPENEWVKLIPPGKYQAIVPIPYFNVGSENIWVNPACESYRETYISSLKTGLPISGILLSRTSISQSLKNYAVVLEPYRRLNILDDYPNKKPLLLLVCPCQYRKGEQNLIDHSKLIYKGEKMSFYELSFENLSHLTDSLYDSAISEYKSRNLKKFGYVSYSKDTMDFVSLDFDSLSSQSAYIGNGAVEAKCNKYSTVFNGQIPNCNPNVDYVLSFWYGNILKDISLRGTLILTFSDSSGKAYKEDHFNIGKGIEVIDGDWALCEFKFRIERPNDIVSVTFRNFQLKRGSLLVDELQIKPEGADLFRVVDGAVVKNNRLYFEK